MDSLIADARFALRSLRRSPAFTIAAVLALGLGIGSAAGVFSLLEGVVLRPLPYAQPERLVMIWEANREKGLEHQGLSPVNFMDYRQQPNVFEDAAAWWRPEINLADDQTGDPIRVTAIETSRNLFRVLGVRPMIGAGFTPDTALRGQELEAVISHRLWQSRFNGSRDVIGRVVRLNGFAYTIVGVMPPGFGFPGATDLWQGLRWNLSLHTRAAHFMESVARLRPGVTVERGNHDLASLSARLAGEYRATNLGWSAEAVPLDREIAGVFRPALYALLAAAGTLLLIACLNVANLLLARATGRRREIALRGAIGAGRARLVRLFITESAILAAAGAALGVVIALASVRGLLAWAPVAIPRAGDIGVDGAVLAFAVGVTALTALAFGLAPALLMSRADLQIALKDGGKGSTAGGSRLRSALVVLEVALAVMLLSGAGILVRSVDALLRENTGVDAARVLTADVQLPDAAYSDWARVDQFFTTLLGSLRSRPEVAGAGATSFLPLDAGWRLAFGIVGAAPAAPGEAPTAQTHVVDEGYFSAVRAPLIRGRMFSATDDAHAPGVVIVNETMARSWFPGVDPVGKHITMSVRGIGPLGRRLTTNDDCEIIGVVSDIKNSSLKSATEGAIYFPERQFPFRKMHLVLRARGADAARATSLVREEVRRLDPTLPVANIQPMERVLAVSVDPPRFVMSLLGAFAALALTLAAVGIYGIVTYTVSHRRQEIGIRLALGAQPREMLRLVMGEGVRLAAAGCALGVVGALAAGRFLSGFLYGVAPWDPLTLVLVVVVVISVALTACLAPGRRAAAEDPARALRSSA